MTTGIEGQSTALTGIDPEAQVINEEIGEVSSRPDTARSVNNIKLWRSYLPTDCVNTMVNMGWDHST